MVQNVSMQTRSLFEVKTSGVQIHGTIALMKLSMISLKFLKAQSKNSSEEN
nr:MAG TPA: hypothetical protein [Caudoviricetes sp.]